MLRGQAKRAEDQRVVFFLLLARERGKHRLWITIGAGPWGSDARDAFMTVERWRSSAEIVSRIADAVESPWHRNPIFEDRAARLLDRSDVLAQEGAHEWLFVWVEEVALAIPRAAKFLLEQEP